MKFLVTILSCLLFYSNAFEYTIIEKPAEATELSPRGVGSNIAVFREGNYGNGFLYSIFKKNLENGNWENTTVTFDSSFFTGAGYNGDLAIVGGVTRDDIIILQYRDSTDSFRGKIVRLPWVNDNLGTPVYSSTKYDNNIIDAISEDGKFIIDHTSTTVSTLYWTGSDYASAPTFTIAYSTSVKFFIGDDYILYGEQYYSTNLPAFTRGTVSYRTWQGTSWSNVIAQFDPPTARPDNDRRAYDCGSTMFRTKNKVYVHCSECANSASFPYAGCYYTYNFDGTTASSPSNYIFPNQNQGTISGNHPKHGEIRATMSNKFGLLEQSTNTNPLILSNNDDLNLDTAGVLTMPAEAASVIFPQNSNYPQYVYNKHVVYIFSSSSDGAIPQHANVIYNLESTTTSLTVPSIAKTAEMLNPEANTNLRNSHIVDDLLVTCSGNIYHDGSPTRGAIIMFKRNPSTGEWTEQARAGPGSQDGGDFTISFCSSDTSLSFDGTTIAVGAISKDGLVETSAGAVFVYETDGNTITFKTILYPPEEYANSHFGIAVSVNGNIMAIGDQYCDRDGRSGVGCAFIFTKTNGVWDSGIALADPLPDMVANNRYGQFASTDGTTVIFSSTGYGPTNPKGFVSIHTFNGTDWVLDDVLYGQSGPTTTSFGNGIDVDGEWIIATASAGKVHLFKKTGENWNFEMFLERSDPPMLSTDSDGQVKKLSIKYPIIVVSASTSSKFAYNSDGMVTMWVHDGTNWVNDDTKTFKFLFDQEATTTWNTGVTVETDGASIALDQRTFQTAGLASVGRTVILPIFQSCISSAQCQTDQYCGANGICKSAISCTNHVNCVGEFLSGRLPYCNPTTLKCNDLYTGTCSSLKGCDFAHKKFKAESNKLGSVTQSIALSNITKSREAVKSIYTSLYSGSVNITQTLDTFIVGSETAVFNYDLFSNYNDDETLLNHIKSIVCPEQLLDICEISTATRRLLSEARSLQSEITVEITYTIDSVLFDELVANGTSFSDGSSFEQALADALGVTTNDITLSAVNGELVIEYVVSQEASGDDPLTEENIAALQQVSTALNNITSTVQTELGLNEGDITSNTIDYCSGRTCNGRGTCDPETGICTCTDTNYWGVNCETSVNCNNGVKDVDSAYCICDYPEFGQRCENTKDCSNC